MPIVNPDKWQRIKNIFEAAVQRPAHDREQFIASACDGDTQLLSEIKNLLLGDEHAGEFLEIPAIGNITEKRNERSLSSGEVISGRFEILGFLGEGGMGQVYAALDRELGVNIALKTIRPEIASDPTTVL